MGYSYVTKLQSVWSADTSNRVSPCDSSTSLLFIFSLCRSSAFFLFKRWHPVHRTVNQEVVLGLRRYCELLNMFEVPFFLQMDARYEPASSGKYPTKRNFHRTLLKWLFFFKLLAPIHPNSVLFRV